MAYAEFERLTLEVSRKKLVAACWHPDARGEIHPLHNGVNARLSVGPAAYQLSSGEKIVL
jgi:hypothetical protein